MIEHNEWYQARYGSSKASYNKTKYYETKVPEWERLNKEKQQKKEDLKQAAALIFGEWKVNYKEVKPSMWLVDFEGQQIYFYPTTNKWRVKGKKTTYYSRNAHDFLEKVYRYHNQHQYD